MAGRIGRVRRNPRGQFTAPRSRTGKAYTYAGRRVLIKGDNFQLTWNGPEVLGEIDDALLDTLAELTDMGEANLESITPYDTGYLLESAYCDIFVDGSNRIVLRIGAEAEYAVYVELGTSRMAAQPYIRPTADLLVHALLPTFQKHLRAHGIAA